MPENNLNQTTGNPANIDLTKKDMTARPQAQTEETVIVKKDALDAVLKRLDEQDNQIKVLTEAADKGRMANIIARSQGTMLRTTKLSTIKGQVVVAWKTISNEVFKDMSNIWRENQIVEITTEEGEKMQLPYIEFGRLMKISADILRTSFDDAGRMSYKVKAENGKEYELDSAFIG